VRGARRALEGQPDNSNANRFAIELDLLLATCLQVFTQPERLQDEDAYHCEKCANNTHFSNTSSIAIDRVNPNTHINNIYSNAMDLNILLGHMPAGLHATGDASG